MDGCCPSMSGQGKGTLFFCFPQKSQNDMPMCCIRDESATAGPRRCHSSCVHSAKPAPTTLAQKTTLRLLSMRSTKLVIATASSAVKHAEEHTSELQSPCNLV